MSGLVCIVGRPNVGKSTLFNRLIGRRKSLVHDAPGMTRDRIYGALETAAGNIALIDTGGFSAGDKDQLVRGISSIVQGAIEEADLLLFVLDGRAGLLPADEELARMLRKSGKPVLAVVNKCEGRVAVDDFYSLGFDHLFPVSAEHNLGFEDVREALFAWHDTLPAEPVVLQKRCPRFVLLGRPNVGKSSLADALLGKKRILVSDKAGTTHDPVEILLKRGEDSFTLIDTAGVRRRSKVHALDETLSGIFALRSMEKADVAALLIDASQPVSEQDQRIARLVLEAGKGLVLVLSKSDIEVSEEGNLSVDIEMSRPRMRFAEFCPQIETSVVDGRGIEKLLAAVKKVERNRRRKLKTVALNRFVQRIKRELTPKSEDGKAFNIYYATQTDIRPPEFTFFCNANSPHLAFARFLKNSLRKLSDFSGVPLRLVFKRRETKKPGGRKKKAKKGKK